MSKMYNSRLYVNVTRSMKDKVRQMAEKNKTTTSGVVRDALDSYLWQALVFWG